MKPDAARVARTAREVLASQSRRLRSSARVGHFRARVVAASALVVLSASIGGTSGALPLGKRSPAAANLWVDTTGGTCTRRSPAGPYADARACDSLQAAYNAARSGDLVNIAPGTYTSQTLAAGTKIITFRAAGPGRPKFGQIISAASNITIRGIQIENRANIDGPCQDPSNAVLYPCGAKQTFDNVVIDGLNQSNKHGIRGVGAGFVLKNSEIRNIVDQKGFEGGSDDMLIENNYWHDIKLVTDGVHNECMYVDGGNRAVFRGNRFIGCPTMALFFTNYNGGPTYRDVLIESNIVGHTLNVSQHWHTGSCGLVFGRGFNNQNTFVGWIVRYNTFESCVLNTGTPAVDDSGAGQWYGNLGGIGGCPPEFVYRYNVGETCGGTGDVTVRPAVNDANHPNQAPFYVNAPQGDFHLRAGAAPINRADPDVYPARDRDHKNRLVGSAPDAGAYEFRGPTATTGIIAIGDVGIGARPQPRLSAALRSFEKQNPAVLALALGDNDYTGGRAFETSWGATFGWLRRAGIGVAGALGERDVAVRGGRYQFRPLGMPSAYYVRRVRNVQLIVLDSTSVTAAQTRWLRRTLARPSTLFRVVALHDSPFACGSSLGNAAVRRQWVPLFERYGVRLVLSGHDHTYQRFESNRVTYVVHGAASSVSRLRSCPSSYPPRQAARSTRGFVYFTVDAGGVLVRAVDLSGKMIDRFRVS